MVIGLMGASGEGKTTSLRNLDPKTTFIIDADKKGLPWKGWKTQYNSANKNYVKSDFAETALQYLQRCNTEKEFSHVKTFIVDTINGIMVADEMRRMRDKGYDKWQDLAACIYNLVDYALTVRDDLNVIFICHTQSEHDESGYMYTRIKTSGKKLDKIVLESKFNTVLLAKCIDGEYIFETQSNFSSAKSPAGALDKTEANDMKIILDKLKEY